MELAELGKKWTQEEMGRERKVVGGNGEADISGRADGWEQDVDVSGERVDMVESGKGWMWVGAEEGKRELHG